MWFCFQNQPKHTTATVVNVSALKSKHSYNSWKYVYLEITEEVNDQNHIHFIKSSWVILLPWLIRPHNLLAFCFAFTHEVKDPKRA